MERNVLFFLKHKNQVKFLYDNLTFLQGIALMKEHSYTAMPVINKEGEYIGTITEGDFLWAIQENYETKTKNELMNMPISSMIRPGFNKAVSVNVDIDELFATSLTQNFVPVVDDRNIFIGIVTRQKILEFLLSPDGQNQSFINNAISQSYYSDVKSIKLKRKKPVGKD